MSGSATHRGTVHFVVPEGLDDDARVSGGNVYDRRIRDGLRDRGWDVRMTSGPLSRIPDGAVTLIDGLVARTLPSHASRLRSVVLAHMDLSSDAALAADRIVTTSAWTRTRLLGKAPLRPSRVVVARPGVDPAPSAAAGSATGRTLLCIGAVAPHKGQDVLLRALAQLPVEARARDWRLRFVGSIDSEPGFAADLARLAHELGLAERVGFEGVLTGPPLDDAFCTADIVIAPSRSESYGMAAAEALAWGVPVVASRVGGLPEALADSPAGILVPPDDARALAEVLGRWLVDDGVREALAAHARTQRHNTRDWADAIDVVSAVLTELGLADAVPAAGATLALGATG